MKSITFSAQDDKINMLHRVAHGRGMTVNDLFREWLNTKIAKKAAKLYEQ